MNIQADKLRSSSERLQRYRDEIDELKMERDSFSKKANTIDKYKQKLQANQNLENENHVLLDELEELRQQLKVADQARQQVAGFQLAIEEYKRILPKIEQDRHELQMMKKQLEFDNATLAQRWEIANEQQARDRDMIANLENKTRDVDSPETPGFDKVGGLDSELEKSRLQEDQMQAATLCLKWTRLTHASRIAQLSDKNEALLRSLQDAESISTMLQQMLDDADGKHSRLEKKYLDAYQQQLLLESSLAEIKEGQSIKGYSLSSFVSKVAHPFNSTKVFEQMRDQVRFEQQKRVDTETELKETKRLLAERLIDRTSRKSTYKFVSSSDI